MPVPFAGCRLWLLAERSNGYGAASFDGQQWQAHVLSFQAFVGRLPSWASLLMHSCDTRMCVEPEHLRPGTHADNSEDASRKGRLAQRVSAEDVRRMRAAYAAGGVTIQQIAETFGLKKSAVSKILLRQSWRFA